jgi:hypothetical protein
VLTPLPALGNCQIQMLVTKLQRKAKGTPRQTLTYLTD